METQNTISGWKRKWSKPTTKPIDFGIENEFWSVFACLSPLSVTCSWPAVWWHRCLFFVLVVSLFSQCLLFAQWISAAQKTPVGWMLKPVNPGPNSVVGLPGSYYNDPVCCLLLIAELLRICMVDNFSHTWWWHCVFVSSWIALREKE